MPARRVNPQIAGVARLQTPPPGSATGRETKPSREFGSRVGAAPLPQASRGERLRKTARASRPPRPAPPPARCARATLPRPSRPRRGDGAGSRGEEAIRVPRLPVRELLPAGPRHGSRARPPQATPPRSVSPSSPPPPPTERSLKQRSAVKPISLLSRSGGWQPPGTRAPHPGPR